MKCWQAWVAAAALGLGLPVGPTSFAAARPEPADPHLRAAYHRLQFHRLYPAEAVALIEDRLQNAEHAAPVLAELAKDQQHDVRVLVALLLGEIGVPEAAPPLWQLLTDDSEFVRTTASGSLVRLHESTPIPASAAALKDPRPDVRRLAAATLAQLRDRTVEAALIDALHDDNDLVRSEVVRALGPCGSDAAIPSLVEALHDQSVLVREWAARTLGQYHDPAVTTALLESLKDRDWHVRAAATQSLAAQRTQTPDKGAAYTDAIVSRLQDDEFALVRDRAADALGLPDNSKAVNALVEAVVSGNRDARFHAARTIADSKMVLALPALMEHRHADDPEVRQRIIEIFGAIGREDQIPAVTEALQDQDPIVRLKAVAALQSLAQRSSLSALLAKTQDTNAHVRAAVARALGNSGEHKAVPKLIVLLRDPNGYVRGAAAEALGKLGDTSAISPLIGVLSGEQVAGAKTAADGLIIGGQKNELAEVARLKLIEEKISVVRALGDLRAATAVDSVVQYGLRAEDAGLRAESAVTLGKIGEVKAVGPLQDVVKPYYESTVPTEDLETGVIASGPVPETVREIKEKEARVRASVAWALGQIGDPTAVPTLTRAASDANSLVRDAATEALEKIAERKEERQAATKKTPPTP